MILETKILLDNNNDTLLITPNGDLDAFTAPDFKQKIIDTLDQKMTDVIIDGTNMKFVDSMGLGALIHIYNVLSKKGKKLILKNLNHMVLKLIKITDLDKMFVIEQEQ